MLPTNPNVLPQTSRTVLRNDGATPGSEPNDDDLAAQRLRLDLQLRDAPAGMASLAGPGHMVTVVNELFRDLFGNRRLAGLRLREGLPELYDQSFFVLLDEVYRSGNTCYGYDEVTFRDATGAGRRGSVYFTFVAQATRGLTGEVAGLLLFVYDVSAHVSARQRVEAGDGPWPAATDHQLALTNAQLVLTNEELATANEELLASNEELDVVNAELGKSNDLLKAANADIRARADELHTAHRALHQLNQELESRVAERTAQLQAALGDTELANTALSQSNHHLQRTNTDLDSFIYTASHDLRAPISNIEGLLKLLVRQLPAGVQQADQVPNILAMMKAAVDRFRLTITQLTDITRLQQSQIQPTETVGLAALIDDICLDLTPLLTDAQLILDLDSCFSVQFAPKHLRSILYNLLSNALKYHHPDRAPVVRLSAQRSATATTLTVQDNGLGLDEKQQSQLFGMFKRLHNHVEGTGIGLYTVKRIVENAGGAIEVASELGTGTTFTVTLPAGD